MFFFEKKNQKTSVHSDRENGAGRSQMDKSLFASFSTEKEDFFCYLTLRSDNAFSTTLTLDSAIAPPASIGSR